MWFFVIFKQILGTYRAFLRPNRSVRGAQKVDGGDVAAQSFLDASVRFTT